MISWAHADIVTEGARPGLSERDPTKGIGCRLAGRVRLALWAGGCVRFRVVIGDQVRLLEVADEGSDEFHDRLDRDMDRGWQMSREFVPHPDPLQRCQIVADRLLTSLVNGNAATAMLMASYIARRMPGVAGVDVDTAGEMQNTELLYDHGP